MQEVGLLWQVKVFSTEFPIFIYPIQNHSYITGIIIKLAEQWGQGEHLFYLFFPYIEKQCEHCEVSTQDKWEKVIFFKSAWAWPILFQYYTWCMHDMTIMLNLWWRTATIITRVTVGWRKQEKLKMRAM